MKATAMPPMHHHMTLFWGKDTGILFSGWPRARSGMYAVGLVFVFVMAFIVEWLSHSRLIKPGSSTHVTPGLVHALRMGLAYMVMLALMSFNGGVFRGQ
ncbi:hypothetical protein PVL29_007567 [Vitis rotundifolia]|uniref:Copper transport protein n=1 Tax=Vitis rotundifolia TaxID=103349 RepID=A0AA39DVK1_VITRO|nr:hypothetical protein PVL29_007567 [Vitis rotundifolia]